MEAGTAAEAARAAEAGDVWVSAARFIGAQTKQLWLVKCYRRQKLMASGILHLGFNPGVAEVVEKGLEWVL
jgi:hypothetical protein